jgi:hypothetical protein
LGVTGTKAIRKKLSVDSLLIGFNNSYEFCFMPHGVAWEDKVFRIRRTSEDH